MSSHSEKDFQAAVEEFLQRTRELVGHESAEDTPPPPLAVSSASPIPAGLVLDTDTIIRYALSIGDDNPLFTDPRYASASRYGGLVAPGPILVHVRYPADHGAMRANGYPLANFIAGVAWEFFDAIQAGARFSSSKVLREVFVRRGYRGRRLIHLVCEVTYSDALDRSVAKAYGTLIQVPVPGMGTHRAMPPGRLHEELFSDRDVHHYDGAEVDKLMAYMRAERRRGADPLFWEDVEVGAALQPIVQPPYMLYDTITYQSMHQGLFAGYGGGPFSRAFTPAYRAHRAGWGYPDFARVHPKTCWPFTPGDEHEDPHLCAYRGQPLPFDFGIQRAQIPHRLVSNWAGDDGFVRKLSMTMHRPLFYGDALIMRGRVVHKAVVRDPQPSGPQRHAVRIAMDGVNQRNEVVSRGYASVYLVSREHGMPELPLRYDELPGYVTFDQHRSASWY